MNIVGQFDYRHAEAILNGIQPPLLAQVQAILQGVNINLQATGAQRALSAQVQQAFVAANLGWQSEVAAHAAHGMRYDLHNGIVPIEIELGHERLVYADFFEFMADHAASHISAAVMVVTGTPALFGHSWHCSLASTQRKIQSIQSSYLVPTLVIAVDP